MEQTHNKTDNGKSNLYTMSTENMYFRPTLIYSCKLGSFQLPCYQTLRFQSSVRLLSLMELERKSAIPNWVFWLDPTCHNLELTRMEMHWVYNHFC